MAVFEYAYTIDRISQGGNDYREVAALPWEGPPLRPEQIVKLIVNQRLPDMKPVRWDISGDEEYFSARWKGKGGGRATITVEVREKKEKKFNVSNNAKAQGRTTREDRRPTEPPGEAGSCR